MGSLTVSPDPASRAQQVLHYFDMNLGGFKLLLQSFLLFVQWSYFCWIDPQVGLAFVEQYYCILHQLPESVNKFYEDSSVISRPELNGVMSSVTTIQVCFLEWIVLLVITPMFHCFSLQHSTYSKCTQFDCFYYTCFSSSLI